MTNVDVTNVEVTNVDLQCFSVGSSLHGRQLFRLSAASGAAKSDINIDIGKVPDN